MWCFSDVCVQRRVLVSLYIPCVSVVEPKGWECQGTSFFKKKMKEKKKTPREKCSEKHVLYFENFILEKKNKSVGCFSFVCVVILPVCCRRDSCWWVCECSNVNPVKQRKVDFFDYYHWVLKLTGLRCLCRMILRFVFSCVMEFEWCSCSRMMMKLFVRLHFRRHSAAGNATNLRLLVSPSCLFASVWLLLRAVSKSDSNFF